MDEIEAVMDELNSSKTFKLILHIATAAANSIERTDVSNKMSRETVAEEKKLYLLWVGGHISLIWIQPFICGSG